MMSDTQPTSLPPLATLDEEFDDDEQLATQGPTDYVNLDSPMSLDGLLALRSLHDKQQHSSLPPTGVPARVQLIPYSKPQPRKSTRDGQQQDEPKSLWKAKAMQDHDDEEGMAEDELLMIQELAEQCGTAEEIQRDPKLTKEENMGTTMSDSLEDLVNSFDDQVRACLRDLQTDIGGLAPVQKKRPDDVIKDRLSWLTLTCNYGDIAPVDWRKLSPSDCDPLCGLEAPPGTPLLELDLTDDDQLGELISACLQPNHPRQPIDAVLAEIDALMSAESNCKGYADYCEVPLIRKASFYSFSLDKLRSLNLEQLQDLNEDLEGKVSQQSDRLVQQLARRDERQFEKETKNAFLRQLLEVQNTRRKFAKRELNNNKDVDGGKGKPKYLNTLIPYQRGSLDVVVLEALTNILKALNEDSAAVPSLLTDYILTHICPTSSRICATAHTPTKPSSARYRLTPSNLGEAFACTAEAASHMLAGGLSRSLASLQLKLRTQGGAGPKACRTAQAVA